MGSEQFGGFETLTFENSSNSLLSLNFTVFPDTQSYFKYFSRYLLEVTAYNISELKLNSSAVETLFYPNTYFAAFYINITANDVSSFPKYLKVQSIYLGEIGEIAAPLILRKKFFPTQNHFDVKDDNPHNVRDSFILNSVGTSGWFCLTSAIPTRFGVLHPHCRYEAIHSIHPLGFAYPTANMVSSFYCSMLTANIEDPIPLKLLDTIDDQPIQYHEGVYYSLNISKENVTSFPCSITITLHHDGVEIYLNKNSLPTSTIHLNSTTRLVYDPEKITYLNGRTTTENIILNSEEDLGVYYILLWVNHSLLSINLFIGVFHWL